MGEGAQPEIKILIRLSGSVLNTWENAANLSDIDVDRLTEKFVSAVQSLQQPVVFCAEESNKIASRIRDGFKTGLAETLFEEADYRHELSLCKTIFSGAEGNSGIKAVVYFDAIFPLFDSSVLEKLLALHNEYGADYSFTENLPPGIAPVVFGRSLFEAMEIQSGDNTSVEAPVIPDELPVALSSYIESNINQFHVEVHFEAPDLRLLRLNFSGKSLRSIYDLNRIFQALESAEYPYRQIEKTIQEKPELIFSFPGYIEIEVTGNCEYNCIFCPRTFAHPQDNVHFSQENASQVIAFLQDGFQDTGVAFGGLGEPLEHPDIVSLSQKFLDSGVELLIETNGFYLEKLIPLVQHKEFSRLKVIVNINGLKNYAALHSVDQSKYEKVITNLNFWKQEVSQRDPGLLAKTYIQMLKIKENESEIDDIYQLTAQYGYTFLLQKYNSYINAMPERRVSDMTPLERFFCWHLRRDIFIRANGDVAFCKQDAKGSCTRGNLQTSKLTKIWTDQARHWAENYQKNFTAFPECVNCDEYFTFNM